MPDAVKSQDKKPRFTRKKAGKFFKGYISEFKKIVWPTRKQVVNNTIITVVLVVIMAVFIGLFDLGLTSLLDLILNT